MRVALALVLAATIATIPVVSSAETLTYQYDGLGRLTQSFRQGGGADGTLSTITNDAADNRANYTVLNVTKLLHIGDKLYSSDNRFYLTLKANGELAVVTVATSAELWTSGASTLATDHASFQSDGNLALYNSASASLWSSSTQGNPAAQLFMQSDGNLIIKDSAGNTLWQTNTGGH